MISENFAIFHFGGSVLPDQFHFVQEEPGVPAHCGVLVLSDLFPGR